ncbi:hypothetical protein TIFTF001_031095 [Ficus carica]|uniref:Uncharacterized protein n=1 Tax=Ficus carica TaxID=3494 RepID=A0AA88J519_FICCA|nr:hypothetical protein TIFTF001_031095 [Ficus carica]
MLCHGQLKHMRKVVAAIVARCNRLGSEAVDFGVGVILPQVQCAPSNLNKVGVWNLTGKVVSQTLERKSDGIEWSRLYGVKAVVGWKPLGKKFGAAKLGCVELLKIATMDGIGVLMVDALNRLQLLVFCHPLGQLKQHLSRSYDSGCCVVVVCKYQP